MLGRRNFFQLLTDSADDIEHADVMEAPFYVLLTVVGKGGRSPDREGVILRTEPSFFLDE